MQNKKGFTIIELIVVIAIIAILAAIVMVNVTKYISQSKDAAIKADFDQLSVVAVNFYRENNTYDSFLGNSDGQKILSAIESQGGVHDSITVAADTFCVDYKLNDGTYWCIDSGGYKGANRCNGPGTACGNN